MIAMSPELSIIVPTYRRPAKLERALGSIAGAVSHSREVIVIDDCPDASGFEAARRHGARYVHKAGIDRGLSTSRNIGISLARGRYLAFLDDDDFFVEGGLDRLIDAGKDGIVFGDYGVFNTESRSESSLAAVTREGLLVCNSIPVGAYIIERSSLSRTFDTRMRSLEDWDFLLSNTASCEMHHVPGLVAMIDQTELGTTSMQTRRSKLLWLDFLAVYARFPASHLGAARARVVSLFGVVVPEKMLQVDDVI